MDCARVAGTARDGVADGREEVTGRIGDCPDRSGGVTDLADSWFVFIGRIGAGAGAAASTARLLMSDGFVFTFFCGLPPVGRLIPSIVTVF